ncbi:hypothetical protein BLD25_02935 [Candidatus Gracilibacteria bacterium GN02-872]|nr:hypothetical protein BLD25_02935 [Candidatus Gracilibacteria bacterium GN02-872]
MAYRNKDGEGIGQDWFVEADNSKNFDSGRRRNILTETQRDLSNEEANLIASNIGVEKNIVFAEASELIPLKKGMSVEQMRQAIMDYQSKHLLDVDGRIGKQTYEEIKAEKYFDNNKLFETYKVNGISVRDQELILHSLRNLRKGSWMYNNIISSVNQLEQALKLTNNQERLDEYSDFFAEVNRIKDNYKNSPQFKNDLAENAGPRESVYLTFKKIANGEISVGEGLKQLWGDPRTRFVLSIMLIFGIFPDELKSKIPLMGSFFKRLILLGLITTMGSGVVKWAGIDDMMKDVDEAFEKAKSAAKGLPSPTQAKGDLGAGARDGYKTTSETIDDIKNGKTPSWVQKVYDGVEKGGKKVVKTAQEGAMYFGNKVTELFDGNANLLKSKNEKTLAVPSEEFGTILPIVSNDEIFPKSKIIDVKRAAETGFGDLKKYFSEGTNKSLLKGVPDEKRKEREKNVTKCVLQICKKGELLGDEALIGNVFLGEDYNSWLGEKEYIKDNFLDNEIKKLTNEINDKDVKDEVMGMSGVFFLNTPDEAISKLKNIQTNNPNDKQKIEEIKNIYQMKLDFDNGVKSLEKIQTVGGIHMINEQLQRIQTERANLFNKYRTNLAVGLKEQYNKIYNEKDKLLLNLVPSNFTVDEPNLGKEGYPTINAHDRKELLNDKENLDINFPKIGELPTDGGNLDSFYLYFTDETAISLKNILEISEKYAKRELEIDGLTEKEGNYEFDGKKWEEISNEDKLTVEILLKYTEIKNKIEIFKNTVENLKNRDVEEINKLKETLKNDSENNPNFFRENISNYENKIKEICGKIYKNKLPDNFSEIWNWINGSNTVSRYKELENRMKIIYGDNYTFGAEGVSTALLGLKIYFDKVTGDVKQEVVIELKDDKLNLNLEQAGLLDSYKVFYDSLPERFKKYFTDYKNKEEMNKTRISGIIDSIRIVNKEIKREENKNMNGDHNSFKDQYKTFTEKLKDFGEKEIKI